MIVLALCLLLMTGTVYAQTTSYPSQHDVTLNSQTVSSANAAAVVTLTGVPNMQYRVYGVSAFCSAGTSGLTIAEATVTKFSTNAGAVGTSILGVAWSPAPLTAARGATVVITLASCGSGNTGTLNVAADRY